MTFIRNKARTLIWAFSCLMIICTVLLMGAMAVGKAKTLTLHNATDSLILLYDLKNESGGCFKDAKTYHLEMLKNYIKQMESRHRSTLLQLPPFSNNSVTEKLKSVETILKRTKAKGCEPDTQDIAKGCEDDTQDNGKGPGADTQDIAEQKIKEASKEIADFLSKSKLLTSKQTITFEPEVMSEEIQAALKESLIESHKKTEVHAENPCVSTAEAACYANRRAMAYLYIARFGYQKIVSREDLKKLQTDINRTIYYNRSLQKTDETITEEEQLRLTKYSDSEVHRLHLLQSIIDNDLQEAQVLLLTAIIKDFPSRQFINEKG